MAYSDAAFRAFLRRHGTAVTIRRNGGTTADSPYNLVVAQWTDVATVPMAVQPQKAGAQQAEPLLPAGREPVSEFAIYAPTGTDVTPKDRLRIAGGEYEVAAVDDDGGVGHHLRLWAKRAG